jgi:hypothetical protein
MSKIIDLHIIDRKRLKHSQERIETPLPSLRIHRVPIK